MKIETQPRDDHQIKLIAELEPEIMERFKRQAARKIAQEVKIPGFRPGKAPYDVIKRSVGEESIDRQAVELMIDEVYPEVLKEAGINPGGPGSLDEVISINPPKFAFIVPLAPEVVLGDYRAVRKEYAPAPISDEEVDRVIRNLQTSYATAEPVEHPAESGDLVYVKMSSTLLEPEEGQSADIIREAPYQFIIGEDEDNWPFKGFSQQLIGLSANEEKTFTHTYPEDSEFERLRGKQAEFKVSVQSVKTLHLPELTDEFAQSLGEFENIAALRASVTKQIEDSHNREYDSDYLTGVVDEIVATSTVKFSPQMLDEEIEHVQHSLEDDLARQRLDLETYLKTRNLDHATFVETELKPVAAKRLTRSLILDEIARAEKIELDQTELESEVTNTIEELQNSIDFKKLRKGTRMQDLANAVTLETANRLLNRQIMDRLKVIASGKAEAAPETPAEEAPASE